MNRKSFLQLWTIVFLLLIGCSNRKVASVPVQTYALENNEEGTIIIRSSGNGNSEETAVKAAEKKAFTVLLFEGLPSSSQIRPLIENETQSKKINQDFFNDFFDKKNYAIFILTSFNSGAIQKKGRNVYLNRDIKINLISLRTYLENKGIIRKFGY